MLVRYALEGAHDILDGARQWRLWYLIGSADMRRRYARSRLGQFWIVLSSGVTVTTVGLVWSFLWKQPIGDLLPFIAVSLMTWQLVAGILNDSCTALPGSSHYFLNQRICASTILFAVVFRLAVTFLLNMTIPLAVCIVFGVTFSLGGVLLSVVGLALLLLF